MAAFDEFDQHVDAVRAEAVRRVAKCVSWS
jgi:hypothetical protein